MVATPVPGVPRPDVRRRAAVYLAGAAVLLVVYAVATTVLYLDRGWSDEGPLSFRAPEATGTLVDGQTVDDVVDRCVATGKIDPDDDSRVTVRQTEVDGESYFACYELRRGGVFDAIVIDGHGQVAPTSVVKDGGAWPWIGTVKKPEELVLGGVGLVVLVGLYFLYYRRSRPGPPVPARWWESGVASAVLGATCLLPLTLPFRRGESRGRRVRLLFLWVLGLATTFVVVLLVTSIGDALSTVVLGLLLATLVWGWLAGRRLAPVGFGAPELRAGAAPPAPGAYPGYPTSPSYPASPSYSGYPASPSYSGYPPPPPPAPAAPAPAEAVAAAPAGAPAGPATQRAQRSGRTPQAARADAARPASPWRVTPAGELPSFRDVGGMSMLKDELGDSLGLLLAFAHEAEQYRITFNGILLHGPPGVGKTFLARATAGEFGLSFLGVSTGDLISKYVGESSRNIKEVFAEAARHVPCLLFFDEFDSIAERRDEAMGEESKRVVNQLLQSLEEWRRTPDLVVVAATNHLDRLDPAVVRPGRFDRHVRVDLPDLEARVAVLHSQLAGRPVDADVDLADVAERLAGRTPAVIGKVANSAAMTAFRASTETGQPVPITDEMLRTAVDTLGGRDRPTVEDWTWDRLVLDDGTLAELQQLMWLVKDPDLAKRYGVQPPSGVLLAGPPGTGKTTVARVFAAQAGCSFYAQTASDLTSKWVGESEERVTRLFARARENAPSIIFIDEVDALAATRQESGGGWADRILTQLLAELDGMTEQRGVFVMAATNRPDSIDPALLRGGRLSRTLEIPLPDQAGRRRLLDLFTARIPLVDVDLDALARTTDGLSGADLEAACQQAALNAMVAGREAAERGVDHHHGVDTTDFARAVATTRARAAGAPERDAADDVPAPHQPGGYL